MFFYWMSAFCLQDEEIRTLFEAFIWEKKKNISNR